MSEAIEHNTAAACWPAILVHEGEPELEYLPDSASWQRVAALNGAGIVNSACLIDSTGRVFMSGAGADGRRVLLPRGDRKSLVEVLGLVKAHAAQAGSCCVAKLYAPSIGDALAIVASLQNG